MNVLKIRYHDSIVKQFAKKVISIQELLSFGCELVADISMWNVVIIVIKVDMWKWAFVVRPMVSYASDIDLWMSCDLLAPIEFLVWRVVLIVLIVHRIFLIIIFFFYEIDFWNITKCWLLFLNRKKNCYLRNDTIFYGYF